MITPMRGRLHIIGDHHDRSSVAIMFDFVLRRRHNGGLWSTTRSYERRSDKKRSSPRRHQTILLKAGMLAHSQPRALPQWLQSARKPLLGIHEPTSQVFSRKQCPQVRSPPEAVSLVGRMLHRIWLRRSLIRFFVVPENARGNYGIYRWIRARMIPIYLPTLQYEAIVKDGWQSVGMSSP